MKKPIRNTAFFEQWARRNGMLPAAEPYEVPDGEVLIADSMQMIDLPRTPDGEKAPYPRYYRTAWAIRRGDSAWHASWADYAPDEMPLYTERGKIEKRLEEALVHARLTIAQLAAPEVGLYRGNDRRIRH